MPHIERSTLRFSDVVRDKFLFLQELGFAIGVHEPTFVRFESDRMRVDIYHGRQSYEIGLQIAPASASREEDAFSMGGLVQLMEPQFASEYRNFVASSKADVERGVSELAGRFRQYITRGLFDRANLFELLREQGRQRAREYAQEVNLAAMRRQLRTAWRRKDFGEVVTLLMPLQALLTPVELEKLRYAQQRLKPRS